jgi:hypothetical protein
MLSAEERFRAFDRERLDLIYVPLPLVIALVGVALGVLVGEYRTGRFQYRLRNIVLRWDQADRFNLVSSESLSARAP